MRNRQQQKSEQRSCAPYNVDSWGSGYFAPNEKGHLCVLPEKKADGPRIDIMEVIREIKELGIPFPTVIRFHDILRTKVQLLNTALVYDVDILCEIIDHFHSSYDLTSIWNQVRPWQSIQAR